MINLTWQKNQSDDDPSTESGRGSQLRSEMATERPEDSGIQETSPAVHLRPEAAHLDDSISPAGPEDDVLPNVADLLTEHSIRGSVYEFRHNEAVVEFNIGSRMERRTIAAQRLKSAGVTIEGQPFELIIRERSHGNPQQWETEIRPLLPADEIAYRPIRPAEDFHKFRPTS
jgi:hypothetical protein